MSKAILTVAKAERRALLKLLKPIDATIAKFGGTTKRRRKSAGRKSKRSVVKPVAKGGDVPTTGASKKKQTGQAKAKSAKLTREQIKRELEKAE